MKSGDETKSAPTYSRLSDDIDNTSQNINALKSISCSKQWQTVFLFRD